MEKKVQLEGIVHRFSKSSREDLDDQVVVKSIIEVAIDNETFSLEIVDGIHTYVDSRKVSIQIYLDKNHRMRLKGVLDREKMVIRDPSDIWVKIK